MYGMPNQFNMVQSAQMGNDQKDVADSFQGGVADLEDALMEQNMELDELQPMRANQQGQNNQDQLLMAMMQMMGGMG